jgi:hypothetical protein
VNSVSRSVLGSGSVCVKIPGRSVEKKKPEVEGRTLEVEVVSRAAGKT